MQITRPVTTSALVLALATTLAPAAAHAAPARPAITSATAFTPVERLPFAATTMTSPAAGRVYVAGADATGVHVRLHTQTTAGTSDVDVPVPASGTIVALASGAGRTYLLVMAGDADRAPHLFELVGATARAIAVPTTLPGEPDLTFYTAGLAVDEAGTVFLTGGVSGTHAMSQPAALRLAGGTWTGAHGGPNLMRMSPQARASQGTVFIATMHYGLGAETDSTIAWDGTTFGVHPVGADAYDAVDRDGNHVDRRQWTLVSPTDYTKWGYSSSLGLYGTPVKAPTGLCTHVVKGQATPCAAPQWPVSAAARRADGSVVLGGADSTPVGLNGTTTPGVVPGGFAVVPTPGAVPVALGGDNGDRVVALAAEPTGPAVWALTTAGGVTTLQGLSVPVPARHLPKPKAPRRTPHAGAHPTHPAHPAEPAHAAHPAKGVNPAHR